MTDPDQISLMLGKLQSSIDSLQKTVEDMRQQHRIINTETRAAHKEIYDKIDAYRSSHTQEITTLKKKIQQEHEEHGKRMEVIENKHSRIMGAVSVIAGLSGAIVAAVVTGVRNLFN